MPAVSAEVKNTAKVSFSAQIRDFVQIAKANDATFILYVRPNAHLSKQVLEAAARGDIILREIPPK